MEKKNKDNFIKELKKVTKRDDKECIIINDILEKNFIIGKNNKNKIINDFKNDLDIRIEEADKLYNICADLVIKGIFKKF